MSERIRCYVNGKVTAAFLSAKLDESLVLVGLVRNGYSGGDVAYFRKGTADEVEMCRKHMKTGREIAEKHKLGLM